MGVGGPAGAGTWVGAGTGACAVTAGRLRLGRRGEDYTAARLRRAGWRVLARNVRTRSGEIDLIALDGDCLVFVEVKCSRAANRYGPERPVLAIGRRKQLQVRRLAREWLGSSPTVRGYRAIRFDAIGISVHPDDSLADYEHIEAAF